MSKGKKDKQDFWRVIRRSIFLRCPECGEGKLFRKYLKQVDECSNCGENFGHIRADDGPAWLTVVVVGHIIATAAIAVEMNTSWPYWYHMVLWPSVTLAAVMAMLPSAKGIFIAMIWRSGCVGSEKD